MYIELKDSCSTSLPSRSMTFSFERLAIIALDTSSFALDHKSMTLLYFSPWVTRPEAILALDFLHFIGSGTDDARLLIWDNEVVNTDGNAGNGRVGKTGVHQLVGKDDGFLQTHHAIALVDQLEIAFSSSTG